ncbi:MAG TPA: NUDIX domain-containing protein [Bryobacteraceae bacterium]|nr:NUDIX domain-containing protein [Bryobacteraceae bacterium]
MSEQDPVPHFSRQGVLVVAAVIERGGKILIGQRKRGDWNEYKWEFPGGKVEAREDPREALERELREELDIEAKIERELMRYEHQYPGRPPIQLIFYRITKFEGEPVNLEFESIAWESPEKLIAYDFLDGDLDFVQRLARGQFSG